MGIWNIILGEGDTVKNGIELIDETFYTDQEKAEQKAKLLDAMQPFKLAQRQLAMQTFRMFYVLFILEVSLAIIGTWYPKAWEAAGVLNTLEVVTIVGWLTVAVGTLYFTGGVASPIASIFKKGK